MVRPTVSDTAERLYAALGPMQEADEDNAWTLLHLCDALTISTAGIETLAADTDTQAGWGPLLDVTTAPASALPFLACFVGAVITPGLTEDQQRDLIRSAPGRRRGTVQAIKDTAGLWLSGTKKVIVLERVGGDAYAVEVRAYTAEVVDLASLEAAVAAAVPAGLSLTFTVLDGWIYSELEDRYAGKTYADLETDWAGKTYADFESEVP